MIINTLDDRPRPKTVFGGQEAAPCPKDESCFADGQAVLCQRNPYGVWFSKKIKNISAKGLTTQGRVDTLIKRQKRSGSLNRQLKAKN